MLVFIEKEIKGNSSDIDRAQDCRWIMLPNGVMRLIPSSTVPQN
jgi:hypothetical protein